MPVTHHRLWDMREQHARETAVWGFLTQCASSRMTLSHSNDSRGEGGADVDADNGSAPASFLHMRDRARYSLWTVPSAEHTNLGWEGMG